MYGANGKLRAGKRGQSTAEYAILFGVVIAAIVAMQVYVKRGAQGRMKMVTDRGVGAVLTQLGNATPAAKDLQYEPYYASSDYTVTQSSGQKELVRTGGAVEKTAITQTTGRTGSQSTDKAQP